MQRWIAVFLFVVGTGCGSASNPNDGTLRVLFIGNSLTYANDMPAMVAELARHSADAIEIEVRDLSNPNYALEDHWADGLAAGVIDDGGWDVVVLQQGPSSLPENQVNLAEFAARFADLARAHGATPALYMVWPDVTRLGFFDAVRQSYTNAAENADAALYPAGEAWRAAWLVDGDLPLYDGDGYHPSLMGSYLAALTIFHGLTQRSVIGTPVPDGIPDDLGAVLQQAAEQATAQFGRH